MAGLVERTGRGTFRITPRGQEVVTNNPPAINMRFLHQFPEYAAARHKPKLETAPESADRDTQTPQEQLEAAYETLRANLAKDILTELKAATPDFFEKVVIEVLVRMGYGSTRKDAGQAIGKSGDEGIDGFIKEDRFGTGHYLHPSKALAEHGQPAGDSEICRSTPRPTCEESITTSDFSKDGIDYAAKIENKIVLIDGEQLAEHMIDFGVGVTSVANYEVKQIDSDYFATEGT